MPLRAPLPWQGTAWKRLRGALLQGRLAHAVLLHGQRGVGKGALAECLAQTIVCARFQTAGG